MSFATNMQSTALRLLTTYGESVSFTRTVEGEYNPITSEAAPSVTSSYNGYGHPSPYNKNEIDGTVILASDVSLLSYLTTVPIVGDVATLDNVAHRVMNVQKIRAQGLNIIYRLQLRI